MPVEQQLASIFEVIEGGAEVSGEIIPFPSDAGATALEGVTETVELGNGVATEVSQLTVVEGGATTTAGVGLLGVEVGVGVSAIAVGLGVLAGVGLYNLAPEFWTDVSNALVEAGQTVGGKIRAFLNSDDRTVGYSEETIEIVKNALLNAKIYEGDMDIPETYAPSTTEEIMLTSFTTLGDGFPIIFNKIKGYFNFPSNIEESLYNFVNTYSDRCFTISAKLNTGNSNWYGNGIFVIDAYSLNNVHIGSNVKISPTSTNSYRVASFDAYGKMSRTSEVSNITNKTISTNTSNKYIYNLGELTKEVTPSGFSGKYTQYDFFSGQCTYTPSTSIQEGATFPTEEPFPQTYPSWTPYTLPDGTTKIYPIELPELNPDGNQESAQDPEPLPENSPNLLEWLLNNMTMPLPNPNPYPEPVIEPDPDPQPEPDPITPPDDPTTDPNPVNPNPEPTDPFPAIVPTMPDTVPANAMFTVYKPTIAQLNSFGGWLWSSSIIEAIKRIWQNPLDGIIAFMKVYADPTASGTDTIKVGILDSEVSSAVVSTQFVTVECGTVDISEKFFNATDYSPFVALHLYLPFIGIVELDVDEFMGGQIKVTYHIDIYTGTCLAEVKAKRTPDMSDFTIVYTFSGNASQQLPLTSAEFSGALSSLVGVVGGGLAIASGGGLGLVAGATGIAHSVTHEMVHLAHSGSLSANAGIMGARTPFLILTRRRSYDANGYNQLYGYPSNKTVFLNNCSGLVKVKDIQLQTGATEEENNEIKALLSGGVII